MKSYKSNISKTNPLSYTIETTWLGKVFCLQQFFPKYSFIFRVCGLPVWASKWKGSRLIYRVLGIPVYIQNKSPIFFHSFCKQLTEIFPQYDSFYVFCGHSGEFFLLMHHFQELLTKNHSKKPLCIFFAGYHKQIFQLFFPDMPCQVLKDVDVIALSNGVKQSSNYCDNKLIFFPFYEDYFHAVEKAIRTQSAHYYACITKHLSLTKDIISYQLPADIQTKMEKIATHVLNNKFVFLSPETLSNVPLSAQFWETLAISLRKRGYELFCNVMNFENLIPGSISIFLTYPETMALAKHASAIIGMRSGLLECVAAKEVPLFALYTDFPKRIGFEPCPSDKVLSGWSLKKLPHIDPSTPIYEVDVNSYPDETSIIKYMLNKL